MSLSGSKPSTSASRASVSLLGVGEEGEISALENDSGHVIDWAAEVEKQQLESKQVSYQSEDRRDNGESANRPPSSVSYANVTKSSLNTEDQPYRDSFLPPTHDWSKHVFLRCQTLQRPLYAADVIDALENKFDIHSIHSIALFRSSNVFLIRLASYPAKELFLQLKGVTVQGGGILITPATANQVTITLVDLPDIISRAEVEQVLSAWGTVAQHQHLLCNHPKYHHIVNNRRRIVLKVKEGVTVDTIPHVVTIATFRTPLFILGRAPRCYFCGKQGHFRRECPRQQATFGEKSVVEQREKGAALTHSSEDCTPSVSISEGSNFIATTETDLPPPAALVGVLSESSIDLNAEDTTLAAELSDMDCAEVQNRKRHTSPSPLRQGRCSPCRGINLESVSESEFPLLPEIVTLKSGSSLYGEEIRSRRTKQHKKQKKQKRNLSTVDADRSPITLRSASVDTILESREVAPRTTQNGKLPDSATAPSTTT